MRPFSLDPQLAAGTVFLADWPMCRVLLTNDKRFPWLVLVPRRDNIVEMIDLAETDQIALTGEIARASRALKDCAARRSGCDKLNVGMIGNVVPQLHVHIVARTRGDAEWPYPVWGRGHPVAYDGEELKLITAGLTALILSRPESPPQK